MELLKPEPIQEQHKKQQTDRQKNVQKLNALESSLVRRINTVKDQERECREKYRRATADLEGYFSAHKSELLSEVTVLENRKKKALKPIQDTIRESERLLKEISEASALLASERRAVVQSKNELVQRTERVVEREQAVTEREDDAAVRETKADSVERELKRSTEALTTKWQEYHEAVNDLKDREKEHEKKVATYQATIRATDARSRELDRERKELDKERLQLDDRRRVIKQAMEEVNKKKNES